MLDLALDEQPDPDAPLVVLVRLKLGRLWLVPRLPMSPEPKNDPMPVPMKLGARELEPVRMFVLRLSNDERLVLELVRDNRRSLCLYSRAETGKTTLDAPKPKREKRGVVSYVLVVNQFSTPAGGLSLLSPEGVPGLVRRGGLFCDNERGRGETET